MSEQEESLPSTSRPGSPVAPLPDFTSARPYRFTWDASTRKPGPASVSGTSEGRGDYISYRAQHGQFDISSSTLALGAMPNDWSSSKQGLNGTLSKYQVQVCTSTLNRNTYSHFYSRQQSSQASCASKSTRIRTSRTARPAATSTAERLRCVPQSSHARLGTI